MSQKLEDLIPQAKEIQKQAALKEAEKADQYARGLAARRQDQACL
jgi:hypothetical protein